MSWSEQRSAERMLVETLEPVPCSGRLNALKCQRRADMVTGLENVTRGSVLASTEPAPFQMTDISAVLSQA